MAKQRLIVVITVILLCTILFKTPIPYPAQAENTFPYIGTVQVNSLNIRQAPSTNSPRVGSLTRGTQIQIAEIGVSGSWLKFRQNNHWVYVHQDYVNVKKVSNAPSAPPNTPTTGTATVIATGTVQVASLNVRQQASATSARLGTLSSGTSIEIFEIGINSKWLKIKYRNGTAFVHGDYVNVTRRSIPNDNQTSPTPSPTPPSSNVIATGVVQVASLNIRQQPSTSSTRVGSLTRATTIEIVETKINGNWLKFKHQNNWAYVHGDYVELTKKESSPVVQPPKHDTPEEKISSAVVRVISLNVRQEPSSSSNRIGSLPQGTTVNIYGDTEQEWVKIKFNNNWAYINSTYVTFHPQKQPSNLTLTNKRIVIDPGHGGVDPGAIAHGMQEKDIVLKAALALKAKLELAGATVIMTRETDTFISINNRIQMANEANADSFISVHVNSAESHLGNGTETLWNRDLHAKESRQLAELVQKHIVAKLGTRDRGAKEAHFGVVRFTNAPSVLVELGFISNPENAMLFTQDAFYEDAANAMVEALIEFHNQ